MQSKSPDGRLSVLDMGVYIDDGMVRTSFYQTSMTNPYMIMYNSAIPTRLKRDSFLQEVIMIIRNMGWDAPDT